MIKEPLWKRNYVVSILLREGRSINMEFGSSCEFGGNGYAHGAEVCTETKCMICSQGEWEQANECLFPVDYPERL